jgi:short-subunit dehydrogenase
METIVITGAGTGLGKELALEYAKQGNTVILTGRRLDPLLAVQQEIEQRGGNAFSYTIDIRNYENVKATVEEILKHHQVTCLINNAGVGYFGPFTSLTAEQIHDMIETNVKGTIFMTKAFLLYFHTIPKAKILNIISTAGLRGKVNESVYVASKFAVRGFSESLVKELEHTNISVTAVYMGGMDTPFWEETDHIKDRSRLRTAKEVARQIIAEDNGHPEIIIQC